MFVDILVYNIGAWDGKKRIVLSNVVNLGWSAFFGGFLIAGAIFNLLLIIIILLCYAVKGNKMTMKYSELKWE